MSSAERSAGVAGAAQAAAADKSLKKKRNLLKTNTNIQYKNLHPLPLPRHCVSSHFVRSYGHGRLDAENAGKELYDRVLVLLDSVACSERVLQLRRHWRSRAQEGDALPVQCQCAACFACLNSVNHHRVHVLGCIDEDRRPSE